MKKFIVNIPFGVCSIIITLMVAYCSLATNPLNVNSVSLFPGFDKVAHVVMYLACTTVYLFDYAKFKLPHHTTLNAELAITCSAAVLGLLMEVAQLILTNNREF
ncbi:MAG: hypothetical protein Q4B68_07170 [Bacteroidales bacterium]|nr:hypothetical protein [Bacteroidales bacterium]